MAAGLDRTLAHGCSQMTGEYPHDKHTEQYEQTEVRGRACFRAEQECVSLGILHYGGVQGFKGVTNMGSSY